jgi:hypothetical protein
MNTVQSLRDMALEWGKAAREGETGKRGRNPAACYQVFSPIKEGK